MNVARLAILGLAIALALILRHGRDTPPKPRQVHPSGQQFPALAPDGTPIHGLAIQCHGFGIEVPLYRQAIREIADLGADTLLVATAVYQTHAGSSDLALDPKRTGSEAEWASVFGEARAHGLRIILMPIVLLDKPRGSEWRGVIRPNDWDGWFERYRRLLLHFAGLASRHKIEVLVIGSELVSTEAFTGRWRGLIRQVRMTYPPPGKLAYSANWDHYRHIEFWDDLDLVGMTTYYKLSNTPGPDLETLRSSWDVIREDILTWQKKVNKPILFTEVGWCSQEGCSVQAWNYYRHDKTTPAGLEEQRRCYEAFAQTWRDVPEIGGVIWWEWTPGPAGGLKDYGYTPKGKPAEAVLREWFAHHRQRRLARSTMPTSQEGKPDTPDDLNRREAE